MDGDSTIKRMNIGRVYEQYLNATGRYVRDEIMRKMQSGESDESIYAYLKSYYAIASPIYEQQILPALETEPGFLKNHLLTVTKSPVVPLYLPPNSPNIGSEQIHQLMQHFPIPISPITYEDNSGRMVRTKDCHLIASMYIIMLEKIGAEWAAVAAAKRQHFGLLAKLTNADKYSRPWRGQPVRLLAETEVRLMTAYAGPEITAELLEIPNSPAASQAVIRTILQAEEPTNIPRVFDRKSTAHGSSRALTFVKHMLGCAGFEFTRG